MAGGFQCGPIGGELAGIAASPFIAAGAGVGFVVDQHGSLIGEQHKVNEARDALAFRCTVGEWNFHEDLDGFELLSKEAMECQV